MGTSVNKEYISYAVRSAAAPGQESAMTIRNLITQVYDDAQKNSGGHAIHVISQDITHIPNPLGIGEVVVSLVYCLDVHLINS